MSAREPDAGAQAGGDEAHRAIGSAIDIRHDLATPVEQWDGIDRTVTGAIQQAGLTPEDARGLTVHVNRQPPNGRAGGYDKATDTLHLHPDYLDDGYSLLHELGHRDSARKGTDHSKYDTPSRVRDEERHADRFAREHGANPDAEAARAHIATHGEVLALRGRPDGDGTAEDPIDVAGDLDRAVDLLTEGKHVRLNQPDEVSTLIGKLGKMVRDARESGGAAPKIDLCQVTVAGTNLFCVGNKGHRRIDMPQLEGTALPGTTADTLPRNAKGFVDVSEHFRKALEDAGVTVTSRNRPANRLRATQREMNAGIVARIAGEIEQGRTDDPIYVTRDGYIIDGHHVWAANVAVDTKDNRLGDVQMPVHEIDLDIGAALEFARRFAKDVGVESASVSVPASRPSAG